MPPASPSPSPDSKPPKTPVSSASSSNNPLRIQPLTPHTFGEHSLDGFVRHQVVTQCWRFIEGDWTLQPISFVEDWSPENLRGMEQYILQRLAQHAIGFHATTPHNHTRGFILLDPTPIGEHHEYCEVTDFQVSKPYRNHGVGRALFQHLVHTARSLAIPKLYLSTHSAQETQAAYSALGCTLAPWHYPPKKITEPFDVQREYNL